RWLHSLVGEHRDSIPRGRGAGFAARRRTPPPSGLPRAITSRQAVEGGGYGTQATTCAHVRWPIGAADLRGRGPDRQVQRGAVGASTGKDSSAVQTLRDRCKRRAKLGKIDAPISVRLRTRTAICAPTPIESRSQTDMEDGTRR